MQETLLKLKKAKQITPDQLTTKKTTMTIKKAGKGYEITDESLLSGLGDPVGKLLIS